VVPIWRLRHSITEVIMHQQPDTHYHNTETTGTRVGQRLYALLALPLLLVGSWVFPYPGGVLTTATLKNAANTTIR